VYLTELKAPARNAGAGVDPAGDWGWGSAGSGADIAMQMMRAVFHASDKVSLRGTE
jgi:hypothetical protein